MKSIGLAWRMVVWMLAIGWIPVIVEELLDSLFGQSVSPLSTKLL